MLKSLVTLLLWGTLVAGCAGTKSDQIARVDGTPAYIVRVQSSYSDIQQVDITVEEWLFNGEDVRAFDRRSTPFDIPLAEGTFSIRLSAPPGKPEIKMQLLDGQDGMLIDYVQSTEVCAAYQEGNLEVWECMSGLR